jgi:hypothetical protein
MILLVLCNIAKRKELNNPSGLFSSIIELLIEIKALSADWIRPLSFNKGLTREIVIVVSSKANRSPFKDVELSI